MKDLRDFSDLLCLHADIEALAHEVIIGSEAAAFRQAQKRHIVVDRNRLQLPADDPGWLQVGVSHLWQDGVRPTRGHEKVMGFFWWRNAEGRRQKFLILHHPSAFILLPSAFILLP